MEGEKCNVDFTTSNKIFTKSNFMQLDLMNYSFGKFLKP